MRVRVRVRVKIRVRVRVSRIAYGLAASWPMAEI